MKFIGLIALIEYSLFLWTDCKQDIRRSKGIHKSISSSRENELANEFQLLQSGTAQFSLNFANSDSYQITSISPSPPVISNDDVVTISFFSVSPASTDRIMLFSPANVNVITTAPVKYGWCEDDPNYMKYGNGSLTFNLTNLRADIGIYYSTGESQTNNWVFQSKSNLNVTFANINEQLRPRVLATGDYDMLKLLWSSATSNHPVLKWGEISGGYTKTINATTSSISQNEMCGGVAKGYGWRELGLIHTAYFHGMKLLANQQIYYIFGDEEEDIWSKEYKLFVPPLPGTQPPYRPTTVILYDDLGRGSSDMSYTWNEYGRPSFQVGYSKLGTNKLTF